MSGKRAKHTKKNRKRRIKYAFINQKRARCKKKYLKRQRKHAKRRTVSHSKKRQNNKHHLLWCKKDWQKYPYARALRELPCFQKKINKHQVHELIHEKLSGIPIPDEKECQKAFEKVLFLIDQGRINSGDSPERMLTILIKVWKKNHANDLTVAALEEQRRIIRKWSRKKWRL